MRPRFQSGNSGESSKIEGLRGRTLCPNGIDDRGFGCRKIEIDWKFVPIFPSSSEPLAARGELDVRLGRGVPRFGAKAWENTGSEGLGATAAQSVGFGFRDRGGGPGCGSVGHGDARRG